MSLNSITTARPSRNRYSVLLLTGIACLLTANSVFAFQAADPPPSVKATVISNLEYQISNAVYEIQSAQEELESNRALTRDLMSKRESMFEKQDTLGVSNESFGDVLRNLQAQRIELMIDLAGIDARRESLTLLYNKEVSSNSNPAELDLLNKLVELHAKKLEEAKTLHSKGMTSSADVNEAEIQYLTAKFKLSNAKSSGNAGPRINDELLNVSLDRAEKQARLAKTNELLTTIVDSRKTLLENEDVSEQISAARKRQQELTAHIMTWQSELNSLNRQLEKARTTEY